MSDTNEEQTLFPLSRLEMSLLASSLTLNIVQQVFRHDEGLAVVAAQLIERLNEAKRPLFLEK